MEFGPEDQDIIQLLEKIKEADANYPRELFAARRQSFLQRIGEIELGVGAEQGISAVVKDAKPAHVAPSTGTLVETVLVVAILAEALAVGYFYRDKLADFVRTITAEARVQGATPLPVVSTSLELQTITPSSELTSTIPSAATLAISVEIPVTSTSTPIPGVVDDNINSSTGANLLNSTPAPSGINESDSSHTNNGHHYGQTPKPERIKENGNNPLPRENDENPRQDNRDERPRENNDGPPHDNNGHQRP